MSLFGGSMDHQRASTDHRGVYQDLGTGSPGQVWPFRASREARSCTHKPNDREWWKTGPQPRGEVALALALESGDPNPYRRLHG
jgi:hypothetical protein